VVPQTVAAERTPAVHFFLGMLFIYGLIKLLLLAIGIGGATASLFG
jgi:hypothetical protein